jgi:hypothetical protein
MPFITPEVRTTTLIAPPIDVRAFNRTGGAVSVGDALMFDLSAVVVTLDANNEGAFQDLIDPTTAGIETHPAGVVVSLLDGAGADDTEVLVRVQGVVTTTVVAASATAIGAPLLLLNAANTITSDTTAGKRIYAVALETGTTSTSMSVYFDGISGGLGTV